MGFHVNEGAVAGRPWNRGERPLLADGAWGTELLRRGMKSGDSPERYNLEEPDIPKEIALSYLEAGSDIILTNTFGGNKIRLARHGLAGRAAEINRVGAALSAEAVEMHAARANGPEAAVAGDIGPCGKLQQMGEVSGQELFDAFAEQAAALKEGGARWIVIETMSDVAEMATAVRAAVQASALPVVASMTYARTANGEYRTMMGNSPQECVRAAVEAGAALVGANCGSGIEAYVDLSRELCAISPVPVWIKANAGVPVLNDGIVSYPLTAASYAAFVPPLLAAGVAVVGGCCGTTPDFIRAMRPLFKGRQA